MIDLENADRKRIVLRRLFPGPLRIEISTKFDGVVQHPTDHQYLAASSADQKMARAVNGSARRTSAALRQMPGEDSVTQFGASRLPDLGAAGGRVADGRGDQCFVALARFLSELLVRPGED